MKTCRKRNFFVMNSRSQQNLFDVELKKVSEILCLFSMRHQGVNDSKMDLNIFFGYFDTVR